ncbi:MAG: ATP-binding protein, partial [Planctomycetota bacterium]
LEFKKIQVQVHRPSILPRMRADAELLQQAFINLFANSIYMLAPGGSINIRIEPRASDGGAPPAVRVYFEDNGEGIPQENLSRVFDPFFTTKDIGEGSGLGLSVVLGIIKDHGGDIRVESELGQFCRFVIDLPGPVERSTTHPAMAAL